MSASEPVRRRTINPVRPETVPRAPVGSSGQVLGGKYRLERRIASGGMASVWRATHVTLDRPVAVKFVDVVGGDGSEARTERFLREAKVAASVRHKNVVDILDFGVFEHDGLVEPYMIMELLEGEPLDAWMARESIPTPVAVDIARQILSGLDAVHRAGIVHRDMKPANVFVTDDGDGRFARVLDFGISQDADTSGDGTIVGTPEYMSPEQAYAEPLDRRSDLYSVGVVLYEMLSGALPFDDPNPLVVIQRVAEGHPIPLEKLRPDIPALCHVVAVAMSAAPGDRYEDARAMQRALADAMGTRDVTGRFSVPDESRRVSGEYRREAPTLDSNDLDQDARPRRSSDRPSAGAGRSSQPVVPRRRTGILIAVGLLAVVLVGGAIAWRMGSFGSAPAGTAMPATAPAATAAPIAATPPPAPVEEAAPVAASPAPPPAPTEAAAPTSEAPAPPTTSATHRRARARTPGSIVRELDF